MSIDIYPSGPAVPADATTRDLNVAIVGTGFSGLGMAIQLIHDGETNFLVFERADTVGGTWRDNTYPGCACDVVANLYSFSFAPNPNWNSTFGDRSELFDYLKDCSRRFGVDPYIRFRHEVLGARWDDTAHRWHIETSGGPYTARVLVSAMGYLSDPKIPALPGLETFAGHSFHSSRWDHDLDLNGKRVAVIGTGASAVQFVPQIQPLVGQLDLYQRTPAWVAHKPDEPNDGLSGWMLRHVSGYQRFRRGFNMWGREALAFAMRRPAIMSKLQKKLASSYLEDNVKDPVLRERLRPNYVMGCKRLLFSNNFYPAVTKPSVDIVTTGIREVRSDGIVTDDGTYRPADVLIFATGFNATDRPAAYWIRGRQGQTLSEAWRGGQSAYLGTAVPGFPNFFMILGPNTTLGHSSMTLMSEAQIGYIGDFARRMRHQPIGAVDVKPEALTAFNETVQTWLKGSVWNAGGCSSWYKDARGHNTTIWPTFTWRFRRLTRSFRLSDYDVQAPARVTPVEPQVAVPRGRPQVVKAKS
jgi:cation diffusion facilitator CzcD-associated flavoprotein CzcO